MNISGHLRGLIFWFAAMVISGGIVWGNAPVFLPVNLFEGLAALGAAMGLAVWSGKVDVAGALAGGLIGTSIFLAGGFTALGMLLALFVLGTAASHWRKAEKTKLGLAQENEGKRSVRHAVSNGGVAAICGLLAWGLPQYESIFLTALASCFSSATGDTLSSELGNLLGRRYVDVLSFRTGSRGEDGIVSLEGSLAGVIGSLIIAMLFGLGYGWSGLVLIVLLSGILGNYVDSILGASLQRQGWLNNDEVNLVSTNCCSPDRRLTGMGSMILFFHIRDISL